MQAAIQIIAFGGVVVTLVCMALFAAAIVWMLIKAGRGE